MTVRLERGVLDDPCFSATVTGSLRRRLPLGIVRLAKKIDGQCVNGCTRSIKGWVADRNVMMVLC
jgi:hypothetical protein